jgi:hypothetical protein
MSMPRPTLRYLNTQSQMSNQVHMTLSLKPNPKLWLHYLPRAPLSAWKALLSHRLFRFFLLQAVRRSNRSEAAQVQKIESLDLRDINVHIQSAKLQQRCIKSVNIRTSQHLALYIFPPRAINMGNRSFSPCSAAWDINSPYFARGDERRAGGI